jgi:6-pyruvoyltetrahydropterin/6-carboxytetrahydropterin synthase
MVCDYKALKMLVVDLVERLDHAMALNSEDPQLEGLRTIGERVLLFDGQDPTTEVLVRWLYEQISERIDADGTVRTPSGATYEIPEGLQLERVRVWETSTSWAEYVGIE